jgi:aryl-alcohol dehydrogenase-like predicted oxidoreductase
MTAVAMIELKPGYTISRVIRGGWQLAGGHGPIDRANAVSDLVAAFDAGISTFDCADIYTGVEELYGEFRARLRNERGEDAAAQVKVHTKLVPDLAILPRITRADVERIVDTSLRRLRMSALDLVQFHWWDYDEPRWLDVLGWLDQLRLKGKIRNIGGTNFDAAHVAAILEAGIPLLSLQVQYSLLDHRPESGLADLCQKHRVALLCYGSVAGGFVSDRWLSAPEPTGALENRSLVKYKLIVDDFGGWRLFQELLTSLRRIADRHACDIATIASRYVLERPGVAAVIVGARTRAHLAGNVAVSSVALDAADHAAIAAVVERGSGPSGEVYALERDRASRHGSIMKYNLNAKAS